MHLCLFSDYLSILICTYQAQNMIIFFNEIKIPVILNTLEFFYFLLLF